MGVEKRILVPGDGRTFPQPRDVIGIQYTGYLLEKNPDGSNKIGKKFDSSFDRNEIFSIRIGVGRVIKGWDEAVPQMSLGESATLEISTDYAYAESGFPKLIPPNADLWFEVQLLKINDIEAPGYPRGTLQRPKEEQKKNGTEPK